MSNEVCPEPADPVRSEKEKKTGLVIVLIVLVLIIAAGTIMYFTGAVDRIAATSKAGAGDYIGAFESYEKYLSRSGNKSTEAYTQASLYAFCAGDADKALMYARSVPEKSEEADRLAETAAIVLAKDAVANRDWQGALESLKYTSGEEAKKLYDEVNFNLALEAAEKEEFETAIALLEDNSCELSGDFLSEYRYSYGVSLMEEGRYEEAIAQFEETSFADSDDLRGKCYFMTSVDYTFINELRDVCFSIIGSDASAESLREAAERLGKYSGKLFNDSELAFFGEELSNAFLGEAGAEKEDASGYCLQEKECLEIINEMYPFSADDWKNIISFFASPERSAGLS